MANTTTLRKHRAPDAPREGLMTLEQAAAYLQIFPGTLKHWALAKKVEYVKVGKFMRFTQAALDRYIQSQTVTIKMELP